MSTQVLLSSLLSYIVFSFSFELFVKCKMQNTKCKLQNADSFYVGVFMSIYAC